VAFPRARDGWRRLRYVVDQARAWADSEHGGLRGYLAWATRQGSDTARVAEAALPETDADTLKIMTIHSAKGLEFPMVIVSGLTTRVARPPQGVHVLWPPTGGYALKLGSRAQTADYDAARPVDEQMGYDEKLRLLYVACTRARDHLVISQHRCVRAATSTAGATGAELLADGAPVVPSLGPAAGPAVLPLPPSVTALPRFGEWSTTMGIARASAARSAAVSASGFEGTLPATLSTPDPGLAKGARDLELAPWHKGRYGTRSAGPCTACCSRLTWPLEPAWPTPSRRRRWPRVWCRGPSWSPSWPPRPSPHRCSAGRPHDRTGGSPMWPP
jgi:hypothetical protein